MKIDEHGSKALPGIGLRIPAVVEMVAKAALRPAMNQKRDRILPAFAEPGRFDHVAIHLRLAGAGKRELLIIPHFDVLQLRGGKAGQLPGLGAAGIQREKFSRRLQVVFGKNHGILTHCESTDISVSHQLVAIATGCLNAPQRLVALILRIHDQGRTIGGPGQGRC